MNEELGTAPCTPNRLAAGRIREESLDPRSGTVVSARTEEELFAVLSNTLRRLFRNSLGHEVYVGDESETLQLVVDVGPSQPGGGLELPAELKRLLMAAEHGGVDGAPLTPPLREPGDGVLMGALMLDAGSVLGLIVLERAPTAPRFTRSDVDVLQGIAAVFSLALQRLRVRRAERVHDSIDRKLAGKVQRRLMSRRLPADAGVKVDAKYLPALAVGGDFYELMDLGDGRIGGAIGDVSGKGVSAALIMSWVSSDLRRSLRSGVDPSTVLHSVNGTMTDLENGTFVTASCIHLDVRRRKLTVANAGHIPLIVRRASGEVFSFGQSSGVPLGIMPFDYSDEEMDLQPLDIMLLMTDGVVDALDRPSDRMGAELLLRMIKSSPHDPGAINTRIVAAANEMAGSRPLDDMTLVALQLVS